MNRIIHVAVVALVAYLALPPGTSVGVGPDAESGLDAPDKRGQALLLSYGTWSGTFGVPGDEDWYRVDDPVGAPRCVTTAVEPTVAATTKLRVNSGAQVTTITGSAPANVEVRMGLAQPTLQRSFLAVESAEAGPYAFEIAAATLSSGLAGEMLTGQDAGSTLATALPAAGGCFGGQLSLIDTVDRYAIALDAGDTIYYSLASTAGGVQLRLLDSTGAVVGYPVGNGGVAGYYAENAETFQLSLQGSSAPVEAAYMVGLGEGPDPGNPCRPYCLLTG